MDPVTWPYITYALVAICLTVGLAMILSRHGKIFLMELFPDDTRLAKAINSMLVTGFFMLNLGYGFLISRIDAAETAFQATAGLIQKLGVLLVSLGVIHFVNIAVFWKIRRNLTENLAVPVPASTMVPPPPGPATPAPVTPGGTSSLDPMFTWAKS